MGRGGGGCPTANSYANEILTGEVEYCTVDLMNIWGPGYHGVLSDEVYSKTSEQRTLWGRASCPL